MGWCRLAGVSARSRRAQATKVELKLGAKTTPEDRTFEVAQPRETRAELDMRANTPASGRAPPLTRANDPLSKRRLPRRRELEIR